MMLSNITDIAVCSLFIRDHSIVLISFRLLQQTNHQLKVKTSRAPCLKFKFNEVAEHATDTSISRIQSLLVQGITSSTGPFVRSFDRLSVCSFVRLLPTCERYTTKTNEPTIDNISMYTFLKIQASIKARTCLITAWQRHCLGMCLSGNSVKFTAWVHEFTVSLLQTSCV